MTKLLLVDCDGTIREPLSGKKFIQNSLDQKVIEGADRAIAFYHHQEYKIIGITNQLGVAAGYKSYQDTIDEQVYTLQLFPQMLNIFFCPDRGMTLCKVWLTASGYDVAVFNRQDFPDPNNAGELLYQSFRKPGMGMLMSAIDSLDDYPEEILYVGDRQEDYLAANSAGVKFIWADPWRQAFIDA